MPTPADYMSPRGPLQPGMFSGRQNPDEMIAAWIEAGEAAGYTGDALTSYVEAQAYDMVATRIAADPMAATMDGHSTRHDPSQIEYFRRRAAEARQRLAIEAGQQTRPTYGSGPARNVYTF